MMSTHAQDVPYALFGTCLGAITAYELACSAVAAGLPPPVKLFAAAVSPPHIYAGAVARLYRAPGAAPEEAGMVTDVLDRLRSWEQLPKELIMQAGCPCDGVRHVAVHIRIFTCDQETIGYCCP